MPGPIYVLQGNDFVEMNEEGYREERLLQELLARHPILLTGDGTGSQPPCRCLLISSEVPLPAKEGAGGQWCLDLFLWQKTTEANLKTDVVQMIFAPDDVPTELSRIVNFLNERRDTSEVTAPELRQYLDKDKAALRAEPILG